MNAQMYALAVVSLVLLSCCGEDGKKEYLTTIPIPEAGSYTNEMPLMLREKLPDLRKRMGRDSNLIWANTEFGNKYFVYFMEAEVPRFYWINEPNLSSPVKLSESVERQLKSNGLNLQHMEDGSDEIIGNCNFAVVLRNDGHYELISFCNYATLEDLTRFTRRLYSEIVSKALRDTTEFPIRYIALVDLCLEASVARLRTTSFMFATGLCYGRTAMNAEGQLAGLVAGAAFVLLFSDNKSEDYNKYMELQNEIREEENLRGTVFQECLCSSQPLVCNKLFNWSDSSRDVIESLSANQLVRSKDSDNCPSLEYGRLFSECKRGHLLRMIRGIINNETIDIRKSNYETVKLELGNCERVCNWWKLVHDKEYLNGAAELMRINREVLIAVRNKQYSPGFEELSIRMDEWRTILRKQMRIYHYLFSDLPVVLSCQKAFAVTREADKFWSKDRPLATRTVQQWSRFCADGETYRYLRSNFAADMMTQYYGYLKKVLGEAAYRRLESTLKVSYKREDAEFPSHL